MAATTKTYNTGEKRVEVSGSEIVLGIQGLAGHSLHNVPILEQRTQYVFADGQLEEGARKRVGELLRNTGFTMEEGVLTVVNPTVIEDYLIYRKGNPMEYGVVLSHAITFSTGNLEMLIPKRAYRMDVRDPFGNFLRTAFKRRTFPYYARSKDMFDEEKKVEIGDIREKLKVPIRKNPKKKSVKL